MHTETLHCVVGDHTWERERKRGKKPVSCPEHKPKTEALDPAERVRRQQAGRDRKKVERDAEGIATVLAWRVWLREDAAVWGEYRQDFITRDQWLARKPDMPAQPDSAAWAAAKEAGLVAGDPVTDNEIELSYE